MKLGVAIAIAVLAGSAKAPGQDGFIVHLNDLQAGRSGTGISAREVPGGYLVFSRQFSHDGTGKQHMFTRRLNGTGALVNENEYTYGDNRHITFGYMDAVADNPDGTHTAAVTEGWGYGDTTFVYRFDEEGNRIHRSPIFAYLETDSITQAIRQTRRVSDGGAILGGFLNRPGDTQAFLVRLNADLDTIWTKRIGLLSQDEIILGLAEYTDGGFALTGYRQATSNFNSSFLIRTDANGNPLWTRYYGGTAGQNGAVRVTADGGIVTWSNYRESAWL